MQGYRRALNAGLGVASVMLACKAQPNATGSAPSAALSGALGTAAAADSAPAAASGTPLDGFDPCLSGAWKSSSVTLTTDQATARGGADVLLQISPTGNAVIDFASMSPVLGQGTGVQFDFRYAGKASATLATPSRGNALSRNANYSGVSVTANVQIPGGGKIALFKDKPLSDLAAMAQALVGTKSAPTRAPASPAPPAGIDSSPIFSSGHYTCDANRLTLFGGAQNSAWVFLKVNH